MPTAFSDTLPQVRLRSRDKLNGVDFRWFVVRSRPHQERKLVRLLAEHKGETPNILEAYCPRHTTVSIARNGGEAQVPLLAGYVFVLATRQAVADFIDRFYPDGTLMYDHGKGHGDKPAPLTIPEGQMRLFKDFNENYADKVVILERPYSDYAFNPKTGEPNEIVRVIDGPLAGREGYLTRFRRDKRLVFKMKAMEADQYYTVSVPNVWNFHVARLHNAEGDRQSIGTLKERAADLLTGILQGCGYADETLPMLHSVTDALAARPSFSELCKELRKRGHERLSQRIATLETDDAELILTLARYERDNPGYVKARWPKLVIRPFLTPTSGLEMPADKGEAILRHADFTEFIRRVDITEEIYYPSREEGETATTAYYAHIGMMETGDSRYTVFANWDAFLGEYFLTAGKANERLVSGTVQLADKDGNGDKKEKLIESFRNYAPTLHKVLTDVDSPVKAVNDFKVGRETLNAMALTTKDLESGKDELARACVDICKEINSTTHLAVWRRYLRTVWLHR